MLSPMKKKTVVAVVDVVNLYINKIICMFLSNTAYSTDK